RPLSPEIRRLLAGMAAPRAVESAAHALAPGARETRSGLREHHGIAQRGFDQSVAGDHSGFLADREFMGVPVVRIRAHEDGVHVRVDAAMFCKDVEAYEVRLMRVAKAQVRDEAAFRRRGIARRIV